MLGVSAKRKWQWSQMKQAADFIPARTGTGISLRESRTRTEAG